MKKILTRFAVVLFLGAAAWGGYAAYKKLPQKQQAHLPTAKVRQGDVIVRTYSRGELRAVRSATLTAPNLFGTVQVTKLAALGAFAREKDLVAEFDDSELLSRIEEKELELEQLDEQTKKAQADLAIRNNQDEVELLRARYSVRRAELEVKRNELISAIDARKNELTLEEARRRLKQLESDIKSRRESAEAELAVLRERKNKGLVEMNREKLRLTQVKLLAPMSGLVAIRQNRGGSFMMFGQQVPDIREGDQVQPGMAVADVLDLSELEVVARIGELDRANLREGQDVVIRLDAIAEHPLPGKIKSMSGTASANIFSSDPAKKFDVLFSVDMPRLLKALGANQEQISRMMATAEANRKKPPIVNPMAGMFGGFGGGMPEGGAVMMAGGGAGGGGFPGGAGGAGGPGGGQGGPPQMTMFRMGGGGQGGSGGPGGAGGPGGMMGSMSPEQAQKMRELFQKATGGKNIAEMTPEQRQEAFRKMREEAQKAGIQMPARGERKAGEGKAGEQKAGEAQASGPAGGEGQQMRRRRSESPEGAPAAGERRRGGGEMPAMGGFGFSGGQQFSQKDLDNAKLPPPPEESSQLDVLLRPGLLADVEIIVEKIPNAIHIPAQAVFEREGKPVVFVKENGRFVLRPVRPLKRTESTMVIAEGLKAGEEVSLQDPEAKPSDRRKGGDKGGNGGGGGGMPVGIGGKKG